VLQEDGVHWKYVVCKDEYIAKGLDFVSIIAVD
jgi:hypothetical protein